MPRLTPNLWFDTEALEAAEFYVSVFPDSTIDHVTRYPDDTMREAGTVLTVEYRLDGQPMTNINGGPQFTFDEAVSLAIDCADQAEVDHYWERLTADGGQPGPCGWLKDRYGFSWQVVPAGFVEIMTGDPARAARAMAAMMTMTKLDLAALRAAADA